MEKVNYMIRPIFFDYDDLDNRSHSGRNRTLSRLRYIKKYIIALFLFAFTLFFLFFISIIENSPSSQSSDEELVYNVGTFLSYITVNSNYIGYWNYNENCTQEKENQRINIQFQYLYNEKENHELNARYELFLDNEFSTSFYFKAPLLQEQLHSSILSFKGYLSKMYYSNTTNESTFKINYLSHNQLKGELSSNGTSIFFTTVSNKQRINIHFYITSTSIVTIISLFTQIVFSFSIENNSKKANAFSIIFFTQGMFWSMYNIYAHFLLTTIYSHYFYLFIFLIIFFLLHFAADMKLWVVSLESKYQSIAIVSLFTFLTLLVSFGSFLFKLLFYYNKYFIYLHSILLWFPQLVYSLYYNVKVFPPLSYIAVTSFYRLYIPLILCIHSVDIVDQKELRYVPLNVIMLNLFFVLLLIITFIGKDFENSEDEDDSLYKTKDELMKSVPNIIESQCAICLMNIINQNEKEDKIVETSNKMFLIQSLFCKGIIHFTFIKDSKKTEYILTKCNHLFHSKCLELWIECKSKCPNCRREITME